MIEGACENNRERWSLLKDQLVFTTPIVPLSVLDIYDVDSRILDFGCGYGRIIKQLLGLGYRNITGIDPNESQIDRFKADLGEIPQGLELIVGSIEEIQSRTFNHVIMCGVIEYFVTVQDKKKLIDVISQALPSNGTVYLETFLFDKGNSSQYARAADLGYPAGTMVLDNGFVVNHVTRCALDDLFAQHGFVVEAPREALFSTWTHRTVPGYEVLYRKS